MDYQSDLEREFLALVEAEQREAEAVKTAKEAKAALDATLRKLESEVENQRKRVEAVMKEQGVLSDSLPIPTGGKYLLSFTTPKESIKEPENLDVVPMSLIRTKRELNKIAAMDYVKQLRGANQPLPNWLPIEMGESRLQWRMGK